MRFRLTVRHDDGAIRIVTAASSEEAAATIVMRAEGCPRSAIRKIEQLED